MKKWYIKELSVLTQVSVKTLHHYDKIGLLKPSFRQSNGYRLYSEADLLKLQQIIALKFFGFELSQIKILLDSTENVFAHFSKQLKFLQEKTQTLMDASHLLEQLLEGLADNKSPSWEETIELIEVYRMSQQLEHAWVKEVFNTEELKQYANFEANLAKAPESVKKAFEEKWVQLMEQIQQNLSQDPRSDFGIALGGECMMMINNLYGKENYHLRKTLWEKGFKKGKHGSDHHMSTEIVVWLDKAIDAYWRHRIYTTLAQVGKKDINEVLTDWNIILEDMYGDAVGPKKELIAVALTDENVGEKAREWLRGLKY